MRPVFLSFAPGKRLFSPATRVSPTSAPAFDQVFTTTLQNAPPALRPLDRRGGSTPDAAPLRAAPMPGRIRLAERPPPVISRSAHGQSAAVPDALPAPPRQPLHTGALPLPQGARGSARTASKPTITTYGTTIIATAQQFGVDPALSLGVARAESGVSAATATEVVLNPRAVSPNGSSFGLFQLTNATGKEQLQEVAPHQAYNPFNASQNIRLGIHYLKELSATFSANTVLRQGLSATAGANAREVRRLAVAAYNAGPGRVARAQEMVRAHGGNPAHYRDIEPYLPRTTQEYVRRVERYAAEFRGAHVT
jgi:soluble lytic murein transglycosylase-like protein